MKHTKAAGRRPADKTEQLVLGFVNSRREHIDEMFVRALQKVEDGLHARRIVVQRRRGEKTATIQDVGPDHKTRLGSAKLFLDFLIAGRPLPDAPPDEPQGFTLEEIEMLMAHDEAREHKR